MALYARHKRNGEAVPHVWTEGVLLAVYDALDAEGLRQQLWNETGRATFAERHVTDTADGEHVELLPGDEIEMWRS